MLLYGRVQWLHEVTAAKLMQSSQSIMDTQFRRSCIIGFWFAIRPSRSAWPRRALYKSLKRLLCL